MEAFLQTLRNLGPVRLGIVAAVAVAVIVGFIVIMTQWSSPTYGLLYGDLNPSDSGAIVQQLEEQRIPFRINADGTRIEVPAEQVGRLRLQMAQQGLPTGGSVGYEIFDQPESFGTTTFMQNIQQLRATEGELARTIQELQPVQRARVHLVLPKRETFSRQTQEATASVFLTLRPGAQLSREQIAAIQTLVSAGVPQLESGRVAIIDDKGNLLARGTGEDGPGAMLASADEVRANFERQMVQRIEDLLSRTVGYGRVRAEVAAEMDMDRVTTNSEIFDPESQVVRSTVTVGEESRVEDRDGLDPVTVANNLPTADAATLASGVSSETRNRNEETINYEISRTTRLHERAPGQVRRLSVAVLVDGTYTTGEDGVQIYGPRNEAELDQLEALVKAAIPFDPSRGDTVEVANLQFSVPEGLLSEEDTTLFGLPRADIFRIAEIVVLGIVAILVLLLIIRPLVARMLDRTPEMEDEPELMSDGLPQLAGPGGGALARELSLEAQQANEELEQMIDINRVDGRVRASSLRKVGEIVEKHPEEAVSIIRNWLYQES